jgi:hypothetical protein
MSDPETVGKAFLQYYYQMFETNRAGLGSLYQDASMLTFEGQKFQVRGGAWWSWCVCVCVWVGGCGWVWVGVGVGVCFGGGGGVGHSPTVWHEGMGVRPLRAAAASAMRQRSMHLHQ